MKLFKFAVVFFVLITMSIATSLAISPDEILKDKKLEKQAVKIGDKIRCVVCQNQSINESNSSISVKLRKIVREKLVEGKSEEEIVNFLHEKYGDFVLLMPPVNNSTYLLWIMPFVLLFIGFLIVSSKIARVTKNKAGIEE